jgi:hypothetical protein
MEYSKLVAVTGLPGLFELINSKTDGAIVRSLDDKSTRFISSRVHQFSQLESIEVYTVRDNVNLVDIFTAMDQAGGSLPDEKDAAAIKKYFEKVYPDMDFERVYNSDMKKMVKWFSILKKNDVEIKLTEMPEEEEVEEVVVEEKAPKAKPAKEVKETKEKEAKKAAPKEEKEEAPKKKAAPKKKEEDVKEEKKPAAKKKAAPKAEKEEAPKKKAAPKKK